MITAANLKPISDRIDTAKLNGECEIFEAALHLAITRALVKGHRVAYIHLGGLSPKNYPKLEEMLLERGFQNPQFQGPCMYGRFIWWSIEW